MGSAPDGIIAVVGSYGSGKTEVSVNLAIRGKSRGLDVSIADLDLVNPYFRTREARHVPSGLGIEVIVPPEKYLQADLPILTPSIAGMIRRPRQLTLIGRLDKGNFSCPLLPIKRQLVPPWKRACSL